MENGQAPAELQILVQLLGPDQGRMVFALTTLAGSCAQLSQQVREQAERLAQLGPAPAGGPGEVIPPPANPFSGATAESKEAT